ncbi:MAG: TonB-dependent receptor, partial [Actinobacteria bacterium]|nr:TonB-dependent receptor [Actinomycetota bacterium]
MKNAILSLFFLLSAFAGFGQITTSAISGVVKNDKNDQLVGATIHATHLPTGTVYTATTNKSGVYVLPAVRVGGPYTIHASFVGFRKGEAVDVNTQLGITSNVDFVLIDEVVALKEVVVTNRNNTFSKQRTGASQQFGRRELTTIPITGARTIDGITKYNPFGNGTSFGAQDSRMNNFTIDGSQFNNNFGLGSSAQAGGRTGASAISLDAIDQLQVNIAPFDIRQSGFTGAGINAVTRSGTNEIEGSVYQTQRNNSSRYVGDNARGVKVTASKFDEKVQGLRLGLPIIKNKLFIFGNYEQIERTEPGTTWISEGSPLTGTQVSRVKYADMLALSTFMKEKFGYETGPWEGYSNVNASKKFLIRTDWNINEKTKLTARYVHHNSEAEINISNSQSAGAGNRTTQYNAMSFKNSGYIIQDNTRSAVLELNTKLSNTFHNNLIVSYDKQIEDRAYMSSMFPTIDIREGAATYTSVGFDPFTPGNKLNYWTFNVTNNFTKYLNKHTLVGGFNYQQYQSNNLFFPASNGVYIFNSLNDFYTAANQSLANGGRPSTFTPARFQLRYSALPGAVEPMQVLKTNRVDFYAQDEYKASKNLNLTFGLRANIIDFNNTDALENKAITAMTFANGEKWNTGVMPKTQVLLEPRLGFNYNHKGESKTQVRGGTGIFTGRPPYVFLSNQIGNNGVLTGFIDVSGTAAAAYGFTANPNQYFIPSTPTLPSTFDLALTDP